jgi:hypothetical protein
MEVKNKVKLNLITNKVFRFSSPGTQETSFGRGYAAKGKPFLASGPRPRDSVTSKASGYKSASPG